MPLLDIQTNQPTKVVLLLTLLDRTVTTRWNKNVTERKQHPVWCRVCVRRQVWLSSPALRELSISGGTIIILQTLIWLFFCGVAFLFRLNVLFFTDISVYNSFILADLNSRFKNKTKVLNRLSGEAGQCQSMVMSLSIKYGR